MQARDPPWFGNLMQKSPEVQNRGISDLIKKTCPIIKQRLFSAHWDLNYEEYFADLLPPANEVPGHGGGVAWSWGCLVPGGAWFGGSGPGGAWWRPPLDSYCCRWYASYWNAFLF